MQILRFIIAAALSLVVSPLFLLHCCHLSSRIVEIPMIIFSGLMLPFSVFLVKNKKWAWCITVMCPGIALGITVAYLSFLHSGLFPVSFLDEKAKPLEPVVVDLSKITSRNNSPPGEEIYFLRGEISRSDFDNEIVEKLRMKHCDDLLTQWPTVFESEYDWWQPKGVNDKDTYFSKTGEVMHLAKYEDGIIFLKDEKWEPKVETEAKTQGERQDEYW